MVLFVFFPTVVSNLHLEANFHSFIHKMKISIFLSAYPTPASVHLPQRLTWAPISGSVWNKIISFSVSLTWSIFLPSFSHSFQFHGEAKHSSVKQMTKCFLLLLMCFWMVPGLIYCYWCAFEWYQVLSWMLKVKRDE